MTDLDTIRKRHKFCTTSCVFMPNTQPCDTRVVLDALDRALVAAEGLAEADKRHRDAHEMASWYEDRARAARADADRLADHLRNAIHDLVEDWGDDGPLMRYDDAREALRQHEEDDDE